MVQFHLVIPAAGSGSRMKAELPKLLLEIAGVPILVRTLRAIYHVYKWASVTVTAPENYIDTYKSLLLSEFPTINVIIGAETRQASVKKALDEVSKIIVEPENEFVLIHDGARCFVSSAVILNTIETVQKYLAVTVAVPVIDSIKQVNSEGDVLISLDRSTLWAVQTPQAFQYSLLNNAHQQNKLTVTDDASLVETIHPVHIVVGERENIKVTTPFDLKIASAIIEKK